MGMLHVGGPVAGWGGGCVEGGAVAVEGGGSALP